MEESRNFTAAVKEREAHQPCFIVLEDLAISGDPIVLEMRKGTGLREAQDLAAKLNHHVTTIGWLETR